MLKEIGQRADPATRTVSIAELSEKTAFKEEEIKATLERLQMLNYYKGQWIINNNPRLVDYWLSKCGGPGVTVDPDKIHWMPHIAAERYL